MIFLRISKILGAENQIFRRASRAGNTSFPYVSQGFWTPKSKFWIPNKHTFLKKRFTVFGLYLAILTSTAPSGWALFQTPFKHSTPFSEISMASRENSDVHEQPVSFMNRVTSLTREMSFIRIGVL